MESPPPTSKLFTEVIKSQWGGSDPYVLVYATVCMVTFRDHGNRMCDVPRIIRCNMRLGTRVTPHERFLATPPEPNARDIS